MDNERFIREKAVLSDDELYRYSLYRDIAGGEDSVLFIMLNPSTADAERSDPTMRRCLSFATDWGFGRLYLANLFAYRTKDQRLMKKVHDPEGPHNAQAVRFLAQHCSMVVVAWGSGGSFQKAGDAMLTSLREWGIKPMAFGSTGSHQPLHPLYLPKVTKPKPASFFNL